MRLTTLIIPAKAKGRDGRRRVDHAARPTLERCESRISLSGLTNPSLVPLSLGDSGAFVKARANTW
jgi:hypothetical protein